jgi:hypothetical protein
MLKADKEFLVYDNISDIVNKYLYYCKLRLEIAISNKNQKGINFWDKEINDITNNTIMIMNIDK